MWMISMSKTSGPRLARAATSFCGAAQPEPRNTLMPLRKWERARSAVVQFGGILFLHQPARVAVDAREVLILGVEVEESVALRAELAELAGAALRENRVTGIAIAGRNHFLSARRLVHSVVAAEAAGPVLVADVVRIRAPVGLHFREKIPPINLL